MMTGDSYLKSYCISRQSGMDKAVNRRDGISERKDVQALQSMAEFNSSASEVSSLILNA
jgi:hypothetical protein